MKKYQMIKTIRLTVFLLVLTTALYACKQSYHTSSEASKETVDPSSGYSFKSSKLVTLDNGCELHEVILKRGTGSDFFQVNSVTRVAYCPSGVVGTTYQCGKTVCHSATLSVSAPPTSEELARKAALSKLSAEDRAILNLK